jgi:hypothetical protein
MTPYPYTFGNPGSPYVKPEQAAAHLLITVPVLLKWCKQVGVVMAKRTGARGVLIDRQSLAAHIQFYGGVTATKEQRERFKQLQEGA